MGVSEAQDLSLKDRHRGTKWLKIYLERKVTKWLKIYLERKVTKQQSDKGTSIVILEGTLEVTDQWSLSPRTIPVLHSIGS